MTIERVVLVVAMEAEARPVADRLGLGESHDHPWPEWMPMRLLTDRAMSVSVVQLGRDDRFRVDLIGTQAATMATAMAIEHLRPDVVVSAGTCGGFAARGGVVGDVYLSSGQFVFHDRRVPLPGFHESSLGSYASADVGGLAGRLGLKTGVVTTGDALDALDECQRRMEASGASVKDMEAAAVAWVCSLAGVPVFAIKSVTDIVDGPHPTEAEFVANLELAVERLADTCVKVVEGVVGRTIEELAK